MQKKIWKMMVGSPGFVHLGIANHCPGVSLVLYVVVVDRIKQRVLYFLPLMFSLFFLPTFDLLFFQ